MAIDRVINGQPRDDKEEAFNLSLRPKTLDQCIGQGNVKEKLSIAIAAATGRGEPLELPLDC